ncbi:MAG: HU family DNA-binding protein [Methylovirgula sp.]|uniref:HU family DNA-binding protein n=1 Tax=Methylovirgula sp. TaxID=1978224 RepID=UPI0030764608
MNRLPQIMTCRREKRRFGEIGRFGNFFLLAQILRQIFGLDAQADQLLERPICFDPESAHCADENHNEWKCCLLHRVAGREGAALVRGETVKLRSFGLFSVRAKRERIGRNPRTGVETPIKARRVVIFRPSKALVALINGENADDTELSED